MTFQAISRGNAYDKVYHDFERSITPGDIEELHFFVKDRVWKGVWSRYKNGIEIHRTVSMEWPTRQKAVAWLRRQRAARSA